MENLYEKLLDRIKPKFEKYVVSKLGKTRVPNISPIQESYSALEELAPKYDGAIGIARDGLWLSFMAELFDLPVSIVKMGRKGKGATLNILEGFQEKELKNKKIIVFDNDVVTGRTLKRLTKELKKYEPSELDLLLHFKNTLMSLIGYSKWEKYFKPGCKPQASNGYVSINSIPQIPKEFRKVYSLNDFYAIDREQTLKGLKDKFEEKYGK